MKETKAFLTKHIGFRLRQTAFDQIQHLADKAGRNVNDWCREIVLQAAEGTFASPSTYAVMAEITATQAILIDLLCAVGRDGRITTQKAQQIVDAAHNNKYKEALELLRFAHSKAAKLRLDLPASGDGHAKGGPHE
jgi:hypothetical protein